MPVGRPEMPGTRQGAEKAERQGSGRTDGRGCGEAGAGATAETWADSEGRGRGRRGRRWRRQDYHRFHSPVAATVLDTVKLPGELWTVS